jgi:hypothetical protein
MQKEWSSFASCPKRILSFEHATSTQLLSRLDRLLEKYILPSLTL